MYQVLGQIALAGLPLAFQALGELNQSAAPAGENLAGAGGAVAGGLGLGALAGTLGAASKHRKWVSPGLMGLGGFGGAMAGGSVGRNVSRFLAPDETSQQLSQVRRAAELDMEIKEQQARRALPLARQQMELQNLAANQENMRNIMMAYATGMFQPSARSGYTSPNSVAPLMAALGQSALS